MLHGCRRLGPAGGAVGCGGVRAGLRCVVGCGCVVAGRAVPRTSEGVVPACGAGCGCVVAIAQFPAPLRGFRSVSSGAGAQFPAPLVGPAGPHG